ncbi:MAG TPA: Na+/H+ antiporter subunit E [Bacteroidota bacterium]|nr:Na+/H+ antiporter subunit E [Bacteroidota bacterium]
MAYQQNPITSKREVRWRGTVLQGLALMLLWLILSGIFDAFHVAAGAACVAFVLWMNRGIASLRFFPDDVSEWEQLRFEHLLRFIPWLIWEIVEGSVQVASAVLHPKMPIAPAIIRCRVKLPTVGAKVLLGNVITLTPGTVTLGIRDDEFLIHALQRSSAGSIIDGTMVKWIAQLIDEEGENLVSDVQVIESKAEV